MQRTSFASLFLALVSGSVVLGCAGAPASDARVTELFNGEDLGGWEYFSTDAKSAMSDVWNVENGLLVCRGEPSGYLCTASAHESFALVVEWRWPAEPGNSGVLLRMERQEQMLPNCAEAQLKHGSAGDMYGFHQFRIGGDEDRLSEIGLPGWKLARMAEYENPVGEWNRYEIDVDGERMTLTINGQIVNEATDCDVVPGRIGLQSEGAPIEFRTIELRPR